MPHGLCRCARILQAAYKVMPNLLPYGLALFFLIAGCADTGSGTAEVQQAAAKSAEQIGCDWIKDRSVSVQRGAANIVRWTVHHRRKVLKALLAKSRSQPVDQAGVVEQLVHARHRLARTQELLAHIEALEVDALELEASAPSSVGGDPDSGDPVTGIQLSVESEWAERLHSHAQAWREVEGPCVADAASAGLDTADALVEMLQQVRSCQEAEVERLAGFAEPVIESQIEAAITQLGFTAASTVCEWKSKLSGELHARYQSFRSEADLPDWVSELGLLDEAQTAPPERQACENVLRASSQEHAQRLERPIVPVSFAFAQPTFVLTASPREAISRMPGFVVLAEEVVNGSLGDIEESLSQACHHSVYAQKVTGLGMFPISLSQRLESSLQSLLRTVAHEWLHNHLWLRPLGAALANSNDSDLTTMNESLADFFGDRVGDRVLEAHYGSEPMYYARLIPRGGRDDFNYREAMRATRLNLERKLQTVRAVPDSDLGHRALLLDQVDRYLETQRRAFVRNDYPIRTLNTAFFAFHGSYEGNAAASQDPDPYNLSNVLRRYFTLCGEMKTCINEMSWMTSSAELRTTLAELER